MSLDDGGGMLQTHGLRGEMPHEHLQSLWDSWTVSHVCLAIFGFGLVDVFPRAYVSVHHAPQCYMKCIWKKGIVLSQVTSTGTYWRTTAVNIIVRTLLSRSTWAPGIGVKGLVVRRMGWLYIIGWGAIKGTDPIWPTGGGIYRKMKGSAWVLYLWVQVPLRS